MTQLRPGDLSFLLQPVGPPLFSPDGDLISCCRHCLPVIPLLLVGNQPSLLEDVVEEDVDQDVVPCIDLSLTFRQQLTMCFAMSGSPALLHQHAVSDFFEMSSFIVPMLRMFSCTAKGCGLSNEFLFGLSVVFENSGLFWFPGGFR